MKNQITLVSPPDDVLHDGLRFILVDLFADQTQLISEALLAIEEVPPSILYVWRTGDPVNWLLDKKSKVDCIIFNADTENHLILGYLAAQNNSYYMGNLKELSVANKRAIYDIESLKDVFNHYFKKYETQ